MAIPDKDNGSFSKSGTSTKAKTLPRSPVEETEPTRISYRPGLSSRRESNS